MSKLRNLEILGPFPFFDQIYRLLNDCAPGWTWSTTATGYATGDTITVTLAVDGESLDRMCVVDARMLSA